MTDITEPTPLHHRQPDLSQSLHYRLAKLGRLGWIIAAVLLLIIILQSLVVALKPTPILTTDIQTGQLKGHVVWDDALIRNDLQVQSDIKRWVGYRLSLDSENIFEYATLALNHMSGELQQTTVKQWEGGYLQIIKQSGGVATVQVADNGLNVVRTLDHFDAVISGQIIVGVEDPIKKPFKVKISGKLLPYTENFPLGLEIQKYADL